jgi:signal transduction histidine kinase
MRDRIAEVGGELTVESAPGAGTVVAAAVPRRDPAEPGEGRTG